MAQVQRIVPCLWFDDQAEAAAAFYTSIFPESRIVHVARYGEAGFAHHQKPAGSVMLVEFELDGERFTALNGGPPFRFTEAISLQVMCRDQEENDYYWGCLGADGDPRAQVCGWLKDRFGLSWQVVPSPVVAMLNDADTVKSQRAYAAIMQMSRIDIAAVARAFHG
ncbi:MAG: VOC family protein [Vicinamibacterales bacterium]